MGCRLILPSPHPHRPSDKVYYVNHLPFPHSHTWHLTASTTILPPVNMFASPVNLRICLPLQNRMSHKQSTDKLKHRIHKLQIKMLLVLFLAGSGPFRLAPRFHFVPFLKKIKNNISLVCLCPWYFKLVSPKCHFVCAYKCTRIHNIQAADLKLG